MLKRRIAHDTWARWQALDIPGRATSFSKAVLPLLSLWSSCTPLASMARRNSGVRPCSTARTRRGRLRPTCSVTRSISNTASLDRPLRHVVRIHAESTSALRPFLSPIEKTHPEIASCCSFFGMEMQSKGMDYGCRASRDLGLRHRKQHLVRFFCCHSEKIRDTLRSAKHSFFKLSPRHAALWRFT